MIPPVPASPPRRSPARPAVPVARPTEPPKSAPSQGNEVTLHVTAQEGRRAILDAIAAAKTSFYIEAYKWLDEDAGREIAEALVAKVQAAARRGERFDAKVLLDWSGRTISAGGHDNGPLIAAMRAGGVEVLVHGDGLVDRAAKRLLPLTHRKIYLADGDRLVTGGRNLADKYLRDTFAWADGTREASYHDVLLTVRGPEVARVREEFFQNWTRAGGRRPEALAPAAAARVGGAAIRTIVTDPHDRQTEIREAHLALIKEARREVVAMYPYFSDDRLIEALVAAKRARPELAVKVIIPGVAERGLEGRIYHHLNRETARQLLAAGIEVRAFDGGETKRFSHLKALMVDGRTLSIGSANADARTFRANHELNLLIEDPRVAADFAARVATPDWAAARPLTLAELAADPWHVRAVRRVLEAFDFLL